MKVHNHDLDPTCPEHLVGDCMTETLDAENERLLAEVKRLDHRAEMNRVNHVLWRERAEKAEQECRDRECTEQDVRARLADAEANLAALTWETKTHERVGPGKCSCGFDAYKIRGIMLDYTALTQAHFRNVSRGLIPTGRRLVGPWQEPK